MMFQRLCFGALAMLALVLHTGCTDSSNTAGTALYAFDTASQKILAWDSMTDLYTAGSTSSLTTLPSPSRSITSSSYITSTDFSTLGWGGMCLDRSRNRLWMVSSTGMIARIDSIRSRADGADLSSTYVRTFQLGTSSSDRLSSDSIFGQMAVDASTGALYITEYNSSDTSRIWYLSSPTSYSQDDTVASSSATMTTVSGDKYGYGVAVGSSDRVFGYFNTGSTVEDANTDTYTGPRLRYGTTSSFSYVIVGTSNTELTADGLLGADSSNNILYVSRRSTTDPVIGFKVSQFKSTSSSSFDVAPNLKLPSNSTTPLYIRAIAHPGNKNWLVGLGGTTSGDSNYLSVWKSPSSDTTTEPMIFSSSYTLQAIALDGSASGD